MTAATPRPSLPSSSQAGKDKDFFLISQARNAHPCITPSPKPTPSIVKSFSLYNRRPSAFQHRQDKKRRFYGPRSISDGTPVRGSAAKARASTSSSSGSTVPLLPRTHDTPSSRDAQSLDSASLHDSTAATATAVTVNNRNSAPTTQPAINLSTSSNSASTTPTTMPPTPTVTPGDTYSPSSTLPSIQRTPSRFFVHHPLSTTIDSTTTMPPTSSSPPSSPPKPTTTSNNSLSTVLHHSPGNISRRNAIHGRGGATMPAFATVSSAMLVPEPLRVNVGTRRVRRQGIATPPISPPVRLRPQMQLQQASSTQVTGTTGSSSMALTASTQATTAASSSWSSSSAAASSSSSGEAGVEKNQVVAATPRRLLFPPLARRAQQQQKDVRGGGGGGGRTYPFSSSSFLARSALRDGKGGPGGGKVLESGGDGVVRRKPVSTPVLHEKKMVGEKKKSNSRKGEKGVGEGSARGESSNMDDDDGVGIISDGSYPEELERLEREILSLLFPGPGQRYSSSSMSSSSERKLHELRGGGGGASSVISGGSSDEYHDCYDGYMPSSDTTTHPARPNAQTNRSGLRTNGPFPTASPPLLDPRDEAQMYALMLEEDQSEPDTAAGHTTTTSLPISDSYTRLNQTGWQSKLARKRSGKDEKQEDENQTLRQIIRQQRHQQQQQQQQQPPSPVSPPSPQLLPLPSPVPSPPLMPPRYRGRNGARQSSGPPPAMRLPDPPVRSPPRLHWSRL
ncbi:hypothetical protein DBV05_g11075 [Lasiodiplodia theobromae]|uniref:Uncharacterized protein n=1 Tax=Lasiodiplodia theobromae TaxID=45133 RepID=A0A5N5CY83_9PEZI|nr:hypothetical protein DBV05_g11075 [Lasiodiplodia theobromae]